MFLKENIMRLYSVQFTFTFSTGILLLKICYLTHQTHGGFMQNIYRNSKNPAYFDLLAILLHQTLLGFDSNKPAGIVLFC